MKNSQDSIKAADPISSIDQFDAKLRAKIADRKKELTNLHGWKWFWRRLRIEVWAWKEATISKSRDDQYTIE